MSEEETSPSKQVKKRKPRRKLLRNPAIGVKEDFEAIIAKFIKSETVRYETFSEIWRDMKMHMLQCGRQNMQEMREFLEEAFLIATSYCLPPFNFQVRTCGLYIMYGLFNTQNCKPCVRFRVTRDMWKDMLEYQKEAHSQQHYDIDFVFFSLKSANAFKFVATKQEMLLKASASTVEVPYFRHDVDTDDKSRIKEVISPDDLRQLTAVDTQYQQVKLALAGPNASKPNVSLTVIQENIVQSITTTIQQHEDKLKKLMKRTKVQHKDDGDTNSDEDSDEDWDPDDEEEECMGSRRARLKAKAFTSDTKSKRGKGKKEVKKSKRSKRNKNPDMVAIGVVMDSQEEDDEDDFPDTSLSPVKQSSTVTNLSQNKTPAGPDLSDTPSDPTNIISMPLLTDSPIKVQKLSHKSNTKDKERSPVAMETDSDLQDCESSPSKQTRQSSKTAKRKTTNTSRKHSKRLKK